MGNIFGDTDDITFGSSQGPSRAQPRASSHDERPHHETPRPSHPPRPPREARPPREPHHRPRTEQGTPPTPPRQVSRGENLSSLVESMKVSYLPQTEDGNIRLIVFSKEGTRDPFFLTRSMDMTLLFGTGFGEIVNAGKNYPTFPDMRLPYSEKDRLAGWIITEVGFDVSIFALVLELLGFPFVYATRDVIAYIRDNIKDTSFLEKCRFFDLFAPGVHSRKVAEFTLEESASGLEVSISGRSFVTSLALSTPLKASTPRTIIATPTGYSFPLEDISVAPGEIVEISRDRVTKQPLKFTFDTFYIDASSVGVVAGYTLKDREDLAKNGVLTFVIEEDVRSRAIVGHIFIDSRGFVHSYEMMSVHKEVLKGIRATYEATILANPRIERGDLVGTLRREITKYCYLVTGRTPVVMPIIIER